MAEEAAGEFAAELRAQIADARAQLEQARVSGDSEEMTSIGLRLRYLLRVAADNDITPGKQQSPESADAEG